MWRNKPQLGQKMWRCCQLFTWTANVEAFTRKLVAVRVHTSVCSGGQNLFFNRKWQRVRHTHTRDCRPVLFRGGPYWALVVWVIRSRLCRSSYWKHRTTLYTQTGVREARSSSHKAYKAHFMRLLLVVHILIFYGGWQREWLPSAHRPDNLAWCLSHCIFPIHEWTRDTWGDTTHTDSYLLSTFSNTGRDQVRF